ncbi:MAG: hypothetical protein NHB32_31875 [Fischerella sp. CENA71]|nr:hypothetical protein [Fischerella sp. CENA71]
MQKAPPFSPSDALLSFVSEASDRDRVPLPYPCRSCKHTHGLVIIRFPSDSGFVRCGGCDSPVCSVADLRQMEVPA